MLAKTTNGMIVRFMTILLAWLLLIDMLFDASFIFHLSFISSPLTSTVSVLRLPAFERQT